MNIVILNDTAINSKHFGCHLVMEVFKEQISRIGGKIIKTFPCRYGKPIILPENTDLVIVNGEGTCHHNNARELINTVDMYPDIPFVLLNSVWQSNSEYKSLSKYKYITVRESFSLKALPKGLENVEVIPDIVFAAKIFDNFVDKNAIEDIGVTDNVVGAFNPDINSMQKPQDYIDQILKYKRICSGRHHGVAVSAMLKRPFSAWPSNTHKIQGMMTDMGVFENFFKTQKEALNNVPTVFDENISRYTEQAKIDIERMFDNLKEIV